MPAVCIYFLEMKVTCSRSAGRPYIYPAGRMCPDLSFFRYIYIYIYLAGGSRPADLGPPRNLIQGWHYASQVAAEQVETAKEERPLPQKYFFAQERIVRSRFEDILFTKLLEDGIAFQSGLEHLKKDIPLVAETHAASSHQRSYELFQDRSNSWSSICLL